MNYVVVIVGLSGKEFFLDRDGVAIEVPKKAKSFRSVAAATGAAEAHLTNVGRRYCPAVARGMSYRVELRA